MLVNMQTKKLNLNKSILEKNIKKWIEQDIIVPDTKPDAVKIVNIKVTPYICNYEVMNDKIVVTGKVNYFIIYKVDDKNYTSRGLFVTYPLNEVLNVKGVKNDMNVIIDSKCKNVIFSLPNERKISVKSEIIFNIIVKEYVNINLIKEFEENSNIECKKCNKKFNNIIQNKTSIIASKEDIMLPKESEDFMEILKIDNNIINTEYKVSYNKIMVKGDILTNMLYLSNKEKDNISSVKLKIPFTAMIEFDNINDKSKFDINYKMFDFDIRLNENITSTKTMTADYKIDVEVTMYEENELEYVEDFYSQENELKYLPKSINAISNNITRIEKIELEENLNNVIPPNYKVLDYELDTSNLDISFTGNFSEINGNAKLNLLIQNKDSMEIDNKTIDILVNQKIELDNNNNSENYKIEIIDKKIDIVQNDTDLKVKIIMLLKIDCQNIIKMDIIDKIEKENLDLTKLDSINIYIVKPNDTLWNIAKKYKTSIDKIVKINEIENPNIINEGQKLLIIR